MKSSLDHLPPEKREKIAAMAARIVAEAPEAGVILLFGSHARGNWVEDQETGYLSDYDLLVVVDRPEAARDTSRWSRIESAVREIADPATVSFLVHDVRELNQEIRRGQFFFAEIVSEGIVLHDNKRFTLARPKAKTPEERRELSQEYFDHWFKSAGTFYKHYLSATHEGDNSIAAFLLHQATERYIACALLVFTGTKPLLHDLDKLDKLVSPLHPLLAKPLPRETKEEEDLFDLLRRAYIDARYKMTYRITKEQLEVLGAWVKDLADRVERACQEQIARYASP